MRMVLSLFPGIDILGMGFERSGYCVVRGPDVMLGQDIRDFSPDKNLFVGVIGGPPCQAFSKCAALNKNRPDRHPSYGNLIPEFERIVEEANPWWFLMENVSGAPIPTVHGYEVYDFIFDCSMAGDAQKRKRRFSLGSSSVPPIKIDPSRFVHPNPGPPILTKNYGPSAPGSLSVHKFYGGEPSIEKIIELFGLPPTWNAWGLSKTALRRALGNAVPLKTATAIAEEIWRATH